jgi:hypothetical protein
MYAPPRQRNLVPWFAALGLLGVGGIGIGVYLATRGKPPVETNRAGDTTLSFGGDPWAAKSEPSSPQGQSTAFTPIPAGTRIDLPAGFTRLAAGPNRQAYSDPKRNMLVALGPLDAGTNDPDTLSQMWVSSNRVYNVSGTKHTSMTSLGKTRTVLWFMATVQGIQMAQMIVLYIEPSYRLALLVQFPASSPSTTTGLLGPLLFNGLVLPP